MWYLKLWQLSRWVCPESHDTVVGHLTACYWSHDTPITQSLKRFVEDNKVQGFCKVVASPVIIDGISQM